jgi:hypothetical protein
MKDNRILEPFSVPITVGYFLDALNAGILSFQHAVVHLEPYGIKDSPEVP